MRSRVSPHVSLVDKAQSRLRAALKLGAIGAVVVVCLIAILRNYGCRIDKACSVVVRAVSLVDNLPTPCHPATEIVQPGAPPATIEGERNMYVDVQQMPVVTQLHIKFSKLPRIDEIEPGSNVFLTFANGHYSDLMLNAASLVADLGYPVVVLAFDQDAAAACEKHNLPYFHSSARMNTTDFRQDQSQFLHMGSQKPVAVLRLFEQVKAKAVVLMDTDTVWLRDPFPWLDQHPTADMFVSTDCLSHRVEVLQLPDVARCGHVAGSSGPGWAMNTGITVWRNTGGARLFAQDWHDLMATESQRGSNKDDQMLFNALMMSERDPGTGALTPKQFPLKRVEADTRVFCAAPGDSVRLMVVPSALFAGGKTMFYSHLPSLYGLQPYVVHATFQRYNNNGKVARFREAGAYVLDEPDYFNQGDFLVYDNLVLEYISGLETLSNGTFTLVHKHVLAGAYQLAALRDAAAMAKALGRILVLPKVWAWCDSDSMLTIMHNCTFDGSEHYPPWQAPGDLFFNMDAMEATADFMPWRHFNFLAHPRTPRSLAWSEGSIWYHFPDEVIPDSYGTGAHVCQVNSSELRIATADTHARVLRVQNLQPGMFSGFATREDNQQLDRWFGGMMYDMKWCCSTQVREFKDRHWDSLYFAAPAPLSSATHQHVHYEVPVLQRPAFCEDPAMMLRLQEERAQPLSYPLHPCNFLQTPPELPVWAPPLWEVLRTSRMATLRASHMAGIHRQPH
eukprot:jgi/Ulvmu1/6005/UM026_0131.1